MDRSSCFRWLSPTSAWSSAKGLYNSRDLWTSQEDLHDLIKDILYEWNRLELDVVIAPGEAISTHVDGPSQFIGKCATTPGFAFPAPFLHDPPRTLPAVLIPGTYNLVDFPAGVVPFGKGTKEDTVTCIVPST